MNRAARNRTTPGRAPSRSTNEGSVLVMVCLALFFVTAVSVTLADRFLKTAVRTEAAGDLLADVYEAIVGNPERDYYGYLGDVGRYPDSLADLVEDPGVSGWRGPYLADVDLVDGMLLDSYASPLEYYLDPTAGTGHALAIISRGPDHESTNPASNPNEYALFAGVLPDNAAYASGTGNADNVVYRDFVSDSDSLYYTSTASVDLEIKNEEEWNGNGIVDVCPGLYTIDIRSATRGTGDRLVLPLDRTDLDLLQGVWNFSISSKKRLGNVYAGQIVVRPWQVASPQIVLVPNDASGMPTADITITNNFSEQLTITRYDNNFQGNFNINAGQTDTEDDFTCIRAAAKTGGRGGTIQYEWLVPYDSAQDIVVSPTTHTLTVENEDGGEIHLVVRVNSSTDLAATNAIGTVYDRGSRSFSIMAGNTVWITDGVGNQVDSFVVNSSMTKSY